MAQTNSGLGYTTTSTQITVQGSIPTFKYTNKAEILCRISKRPNNISALSIKEQ